MKRLLFRLLLTALPLIAPLLSWVGFPALPVFLEDGLARTAVTDETFADDAEWEARTEESRPASRARLRLGRRAVKALQVIQRADERAPLQRFELVVDVRRIKPKRLFAPPYVHPRIVRLLS